ncbi:hypothetical protein B5M09_002760 [Aphanomyces astaci]|uniref:Pentacotripeptide-repeat region of PRORP domain-containing protein n=1 Tax=Aphanomyces astaci TaxID=112090 RepID=A0A3R7WVS8_APHAT|nr:hypothetical protein B5M09_002760 [Aphanomyces astaci]
MCSPKSKLNSDIRRNLDKKLWVKAARVGDAILAENPTPQNIAHVLEAYVAANQLDKVDAIVKSMQTAQWPVPTLGGIMFLLKHFCRREVRADDGKQVIVDVDRAFAVYKASKVQGLTIFHPKMLYPVVMQLGEWEAAVDLFLGSLRADATNPPQLAMRTTKVVRTEAFHDVVRVCAKMRQYDAMLQVVHAMVVAYGHEVYPTVFKSMWFDPVRYSFHGLNGVTDKNRSDLLDSFAAAIVSCLQYVEYFDPLS